MPLDTIDLDALRRSPRVSCYFRYRLHRSDFHELRVADQLHGHYASKPLHARLTPQGRVDRSSSYSGDVAVLFIPGDARTTDDASVILTHIDPRQVALESGRRNWPAIHQAAREAIRGKLGLPPASAEAGSRSGDAAVPACDDRRGQAP
ncbi:hypothetical protein [Rhodanobacter sp. DHB23]|uniref:hypothetical protein n=1 Tax=Rhodanobacter sp. DHB23 TaxID=2775923 RepID=UPI00177B4D9A|nr:hypothetical protein [Rhodanobacter sp. DHB23]MBD8873620.1 hypothetical protein [Rhodanobacter sp. DHB23]